MFLLSLSETGRILSVGIVPEKDFIGAALPSAAALVDSVPDDAQEHYKYLDGKFVYDPMQKNAEEDEEEMTYG